MTSLAELERKINNVCQIGTISEVYTTQRPKDHDDYALYARVDIMGRTTDFFPLMAQMGEFKKHYCPPYVGEQVMVLCPGGNANVGYILRGVFDNDSEPITHSIKDRKTEYLKYKDGTKGEISLHDKKIKFETPNDIEIKVKDGKHLHIKVDKEIEISSSLKVLVKAPAVVVESQSIDLGAKGGLPVLTEACICPYTGSPHSNGSKITRSI